MLSGEPLWPKGSFSIKGTAEQGACIREYSNRPRSVDGFLAASATRLPDKIAIIDEHRSLSFSGLQREVKRAATFLALQYSIEIGNRVALLVPGSIEFVVLFLATLKLGAVAVPLNSKLSPHELEFNLVNSGASILIAAQSSLDKLTSILPRTPVKHIVPVDPPSFVWEEVSGATKVPANDKPYNEDDCAVILYTSGTTGRPKGAMISHKNIIHSVMSYAHTLQLTEDDSTIVAVPLFYVTGLIAQLLLFLYLGGKTIIMPRFDSDELLVLASRHNVTFLHAVETVYLKLLDSPLRQRLALKSMRMFACGGGPIMPRTIASLKRWLPWVDIRTVYGLTETSSPATVMPGDIAMLPSKIRSCGRPIPVIDCRVVSEEGYDLASNQPGELLLRGPVVIKGYWTNENASVATIKDGWLRTGDIALYDDEGFVYILDRIKDMVNRGGEKVFSSEVEAVLSDYPGIKEVAVVGIPDPTYGETPKAFIVPRPNASLSAEELTLFAKSRLAKYKVPTEWEFIEELPKSANGKVLKALLRGNATLPKYDKDY